ncbi:class I SAM-dependent methyltransferase [Evansella cellulosilytica]|uniref:SAM-dependent methyltransferase n=1 Tax=Evansella cellulosilytica (strain ATCC 21833 / DSM 2522 / FERM P-1141 / JCM 9156 / N-4) TaxID=649639 RepID=E6TS17_EVAC2|nr:class I SAM-dependent methyltransferase [Evansella cellulosilytica]ADU30671.1 hypothetical protein Bcell_2414 [Evansella cellulosilytica DSM 2522]
MDRLIVTTAGRPSEGSINEAKNVASELDCRYVVRNKRSIGAMITTYHAAVLVVAKDKLLLQAYANSPPFFFHPNAAMIRAKHWIKAKEDPLVQACKIKQGDSFFDATLGLGSDAIVASLATGINGSVFGAEYSKVISYIVKTGLKGYESGNSEVNQAMRRISVIHDSHVTILQSMEDKSVDIVYFDPLFEEVVEGSHGFDSMRPYTVRLPITDETITEAKRVAKKRVVLKDHFRSKRFMKLGFKVQVRPSATFHYGTIELEE